MGLKFRLFALVLLFAIISSIESRKTSGGKRVGGGRHTTRTPHWTTRKHTLRPTTRKHTLHPTTRKHTLHPTTRKHTLHPTTRKHTLHPTTRKHTLHPTTRKHTLRPTTRKHTLRPTTLKHTLRPTTPMHTLHPTTPKPTLRPKNTTHTLHPTTPKPTPHPTHTAPKSTQSPTTRPPPAIAERNLPKSTIIQPESTWVILTEDEIRTGVKTVVNATVRKVVNNVFGKPGNVQPTPNRRVTDQELKNITEQLFKMDDNNGAKYIALNLQSRFTGKDTNITDASTGPLFNVDPAAYRIPTVKGIRSLYAAIAAVENKTQESSQHEETLFVDLVLNTNVMTVAMDFLSRKNLVKKGYYEHKDILNHIWFTPYEENSSGFKRVFNGELFGEGVFMGLQDWRAFDHQEKANKANYLSYANKVVLGKSPPERLILKANYDIRGARKAGAALFVGISPELQMALYTICCFARPNDYCDVSLGGTNVKLFTHTFVYFGKDLIDAAYPVLD